MRKILAPALLATIFVLSAWLFFAVQAQAAPPAQQATKLFTWA